ncbi:MAG: hypothetical protein RLZ68_1159, partial [Pseudomonadota bacterium]
MPLAPVRYACIAIFSIAILLPGISGGQTVGAVNNNSALPNLGDASTMSASAERRLGDRIARELYRDPDYLDDPVIMEYVQAIWQPLLAAARLRGELPAEIDSAFAWEILLGRDRAVNAFALPGAYLGLHLGLVGVVTSRDELASVLAHELSHVTQRHISRLISRQSSMAPWVMGAMILGVLAASKSPGAANAMIVGGQAASAQSQLNFSRDMEREADRVGFGVLSQAGFELHGFVTMFEKLQQASRLNDSGGFPYLRSHPLTTERMADMQSRMPQGNPSVNPLDLVPVDWVHAMVSARARVLSNANVDGLRAWSAQVASAELVKLTTPAQVAALYGATLAALKLREYAAAQATWSRLDGLTRSNAAAARTTALLGAELALAQGVPTRVQTLLQGLPDTDRAVLFLHAQAGIAVGKVEPVAQDLQAWLADHPSDAQAWQWLAQADTARGKAVAGIRAQAEASVAQLDYAAALEQLKAAQNMVRQGSGGADHIEASILDTRTRQVELLVREQAV